MIGPPRRLAAALTGLGVLLCVLGWYQASGQPTVAQQIPYLASATIPGAALLAAGAVALLRPSASAGAGAASRASEASERPGVGAAAAAVGGRPAGAEVMLLRVPDGRYAHVAECPLLDGRTDAVELSGEEAATTDLRPCPLCRASLDSASGPS